MDGDRVLDAFELEPVPDMQAADVAGLPPVAGVIRGEFTTSSVYPLAAACSEVVRIVLEAAGGNGVRAVGIAAMATAALAIVLEDVHGAPATWPDRSIARLLRRPSFRHAARAIRLERA